MSKSVETKGLTALEAVFLIACALFVCFLVYVGVEVVKGYNMVQEQQGYCKALEGRYLGTDGPYGICIKDGNVVKEWK